MYQPLLNSFLSHDYKCFFSSYIHLEAPHQQNEFAYQNASSGREEIVFFIFHLDGSEVVRYEPQVHCLGAGESIIFNAREELGKLGVSDFQGSILGIVHPIDLTSEDLTQKDLVCLWSSPVKKSICHIGLGGSTRLNVTGRKEKQTYLMYCPAVLSSETEKTMVIFFNHSSEAGYADTAKVVPVLHNLHGATVRGPELSANPYGTFLIDVDQVFGEEGKKLLDQTGGRGSLTVHHRGHTFATLFFHSDKKTGDIIIGTHTNPPVGVINNYHIVHYWYNYLASKIPGLYLFWLVKDAIRPWLR